MPSFQEIYGAARKAFPGVRLGGGMATYFTELNRKRPPAALLDYVTNTTCPNVHAADDRSVMETMEALPYQILSTRSFMGDLPYRIGPSQLGCRENAYGNATAANPDNGRVCLCSIDPRQRGIFNAAWTLAYVASFARGGVEAIALGAPTGPFGHIRRRTDYAQPGFDERAGTAVYPAFHVFAGLARLSGKPLIATEVSAPAAIDALAVSDGAATELWVANKTGARCEVDVAGKGRRPRHGDRRRCLRAADQGAGFSRHGGARPRPRSAFPRRLRGRPDRVSRVTPTPLPPCWGRAVSLNERSEFTETG